MNSFIKQISDGLPSMDNIIVAPLVRQISWTNNVLIFFSHRSTLRRHNIMCSKRRCYGRICVIKDNISNSSFNLFNRINWQRCFTKRSLYRMEQFYETYMNSKIVSPLVSQISWTNNIIIFSHESTIEEKED